MSGLDDYYPAYAGVDLLLVLYGGLLVDGGYALAYSARLLLQC